MLMLRTYNASIFYSGLLEGAIIIDYSLFLFVCTLKFSLISLDSIVSTYELVCVLFADEWDFPRGSTRNVGSPYYQATTTYCQVHK